MADEKYRRAEYDADGSTIKLHLTIFATVDNYMADIYDSSRYGCTLPVGERRLSARIDAHYHVRLSGIDSEDQRFREETLLDNLSANGVYMRLQRRLVRGTQVSLALRLSMAPAQELPALRLAARGVVVRVEMQPDGSFGTAVEFKHRRVF